jgi:nucleotide-binding universal stress UspA family protein
VVPSTIIVGYDGRENADDALALGISLAQRNSSRLLLAFVYGDETVRHEAAEDVLRRGMRALPYGLPADQRAIPGAPPDRLLTELAESVKADVIVIGSTDRSPEKRMVVGSLGEQLLRHSPCALAVAPQDFRNHAASPLVQAG